MSLDGRPSGTRTRLVRLVPELANRGHQVTVAHGPELDIQARTLMQVATLREVSPPPGPGPVRRLAMQRLVYKGLLREASPAAVSAETWPMPQVPGLLPVVHDLRYLTLGTASRRVFERFLRDGCRRAARIHTDSHTVADELAAHFAVDPRRIDVVPIGVPLPDVEELSATEPPVAPPYVLVVGHDEPRKDLAFVRLIAGRARELGITVVRAGREQKDQASRGYRAGRVSSEGSKANEAAPKGEIRSLGIVTDSQRDALYHHAVAVLVPSRHEGFGLVPLEGLAAGAWIIASDIPAHREILGEAPTFFSLGDLEAAFDQILCAHRAGVAERAERRGRGRTQASRYSLASSAEAFEASLATAGLS